MLVLERPLKGSSLPKTLILFSAGSAETVRSAFLKPKIRLICLKMSDFFASER